MNTIRSKMSKKAIAALMAVMIMSAPVTSMSFAAEEPGAAPEKPVAASHEDNSKIEEYNKKVDDYNQSAKQYNDSVDKEHEAAVEETNRMNAEIDQHNAAEQQRVNDAKERNAQAQKAADEENLRIEKENEEEKNRVDQHNKEEEEKYNASQKARSDAEAMNKEIEEHNAQVEKYNADMEQYQKDLDKYNADRIIEEKILSRGYSSVKAYNDMIEKNYNEPARKSVEKNASAEKISVSDTYTIEPAAEKSGVKVTVHIEHNLLDLGISYTEDFEIDANDIIKVSPMSAIGEQTSPGYATFYYNTDEQHQMGYWMEAYSSVGSNARYNNSDWNCGDTHEISYKEGKNHAFDKEEIVVEYNYMWNPLRTYPLYDTPVEPTKPEGPSEARTLVDIPEQYNPNYETYEAKPYVIADLEEIIEADIWENIADPEKKDHISLLDYMTLFDVPAVAETAKVIKNAAPAAANAAISNEVMTLTAANAAEVSENAVPMTLIDSETPQAPAGAWALINLLSALVTAMLSLIMMIRYFRARREENEETGEVSERNRKGILRLASLIPAIGAIAAFLLTENMANPMILTDNWTVMMIIILAIQTGVALLVGKKDSDKEETLENA